MNNKNAGFIIIAVLLFLALLDTTDSPILWGIFAAIAGGIWLLCIFVAWKDRKKQLF